MIRKVIRGIGDVVIGLAAIAAMHWHGPSPVPTWTTTEVLRVHEEILGRVTSQARLESIALRAELAAAAARRAARRAPYLAVAGAMFGYLAAVAVDWLF